MSQDAQSLMTAVANSSKALSHKAAYDKTIWIFYGYVKGIPDFDRSMPGTCQRQADDRVAELKGRGKPDAYWTYELPKNFWY